MMSTRAEAGKNYTYSGLSTGLNKESESEESLELGGSEHCAEADEQLTKMLRLGFIRKVYGILSCQLLLTACVSALLSMVPACRAFVLATPSLMWVGMLGSIGVLFALFKYKDSHPLNAHLLLVWTLMEAYTVGVVCASYTAAGQGALIVEALGLTFAVFAALTLFTCQSKIDFSFMRAGLSSALVVLIVWSLVSYVCGFSTGGLYSYFGATLFSGYIVFDTFLITQRLGYDDYILAAVTLYLDILNLFLFILQILSARSGSR